MSTRVSDNKATLLIEALTLPQFAQKLQPRQIQQSRQTLWELKGEVSTDIKVKIEEVLEAQ